MSAETLDFELAGAKVSIPADKLIANWLAAARATPKPTALIAVEPPRIGQFWKEQGGIYAGMVRGDEDQLDYHLVVHSGEVADFTWNQSMDWATKLTEGGFADYTLPKRKEQAILFGNVPELFQPKWYWSCAQSASNPDYAWNQNFHLGSQDYNHKSNEGRARAVRRVLVIQ